MNVPLFNCALPKSSTDALAPLWESGALASGSAVAGLERAVSKYLGKRSVIALSDMTHALMLALKLAGVREGDEVATLAFNCMSSNSAISLIGATPAWIDVDPRTVTIDLEDLVRSISSRTKAVVVYHVAGYPGDLAGVRAICNSYGLPLIEDANAALGASWSGSLAGTFGDYAVFSFYSNRQINGIEGAALVCSDQKDEARARRLRRFGIDGSRFRLSDGEIDPDLDVPEIGFSASLPNINAQLALLSMGDLDERLSRNLENISWLKASVDTTDFTFIEELPQARSSFWVGLARSQKREELMSKLKANGIQCSKLHSRNDRYSGFGARSRTLPGTGVLEREMFAIPCGWWLKSDDVEKIAKSI